MSIFSPVIGSMLPSFILSSANFGQALLPKKFLDMGPATPCADWQMMYEYWEPIVYLNGGTPAMKAARYKYLPQIDKEPDIAYSSRLQRSALYGAYAQTIKSLSSLPFLTPIQTKGLPSEMDYLVYEANDEGDSLQTLGKALMMDMLNYGKCHIIVDTPYTADTELSLADVRALGIRPYLGRISPLNGIGWTYDKVGSKKVLSSFRVFEDVVENDPEKPWIENTYQQVKVIEPESITVYRQDPKNNLGMVEYDIFPNGTGKVNVITVYANKTGFMTSRPVFEELADQNLRHFTKLSDLDNIEHVCSVPFLWGTGIPKDFFDSVKVSPHGMLAFEDKDVNISYLEHKGTAIGAVQESIRAIEARMLAMGAHALVNKSNGTRETAQGKASDEVKGSSILQSAVVELERGLAQALALAAELNGISVDEKDIIINIGDKMTLSVDANELTSLIAMGDNGMISIEDLTLELQRRGTLAESTELKKPAMKVDSPNTSNNNANVNIDEQKQTSDNKTTN